MGFNDILGFNKSGVVIAEDVDKYDAVTAELVEITNKDHQRLTMNEALKEADIFIGVSAANLVSVEMVESMRDDAIVFAMANPVPEISYLDAKEGGARVVGTGRSDFPNQINNVLAFPGLFRGALDCRATKITEEMKLAAAEGIASLVSEDELTEEYVVPDVFDERVADTVAKSVMKVAREIGVAKQ